MSYSPKKRNSNDIDLEYVFQIAGNVFLVLFSIFLIYAIFYAYFNIYKPKEKQYIKGTRHAFMIIQDELTQFYKEKKYIYPPDQTDSGIAQDEFCELLVRKYGKRGGSCVSSDSGYKENFIFKGTNVAVYGMEKPPFKLDGTLVKEFYIDVNGTKGENQMGIDIFPARIYSWGLLGGKITPVNCKAEDQRRLDIPYAKICQPGVDINFLDTKIPIGFDIIQVGSNNGKSKRLNKNVPFLRADCSAFGAELLGYDEYCEQKRYYWMTSCYHEYPCAIEITGKFKD